MVVSLKTDLRFPKSGQQGHGTRIIHSKIVKYGASLLGIPPKKMYDALMLERHEINYYSIKEGNITEYKINSKAITRDYINWYFTYIVELTLRIAFLNQIGCECKEELVESVLTYGINVWVKETELCFENEK